MSRTFPHSYEAISPGQPEMVLPLTVEGVGHGVSHIRDARGRLVATCLRRGDADRIANAMNRETSQ